MFIELLTAFIEKNNKLVLLRNTFEEISGSMKKIILLIVLIILIISCISMIESSSNRVHGNISMPSKFDIYSHQIYSNVFLHSFYKDYVDSMNLEGNEKIMDFGSGWATMSEMLAKKLEKGGQVTCLDISEKWINFSKTKLENYNNVNFICGNITTLEIPSSSYDCIVIHYVLHDIGIIYRNEIIKKHAQILKKGGKVFLREPLMIEEDIDSASIINLMKNNGLICNKINIKHSFIMGNMVEGLFIKK